MVTTSLVSVASSVVDDDSMREVFDGTLAEDGVGFTKADTAKPVERSATKCRLNVFIVTVVE